MRVKRAVLGSLLLICAAAGPVEAQAPKPARRGENYALLVGVREYDPNQLRSLSYTEPDMVELAAVLRAAGYRRVVLMTQTEGARRARFLPMADKIRAELKGLLQDRQPGDNILVAFSGHGVRFRGNTRDYFCPMDAKLTDVKTLIPLDEVYNGLERCEADVKLLLVDACRNDPLSDNAKAAPVVKVESVSRPQASLPPGGVAALFSCSMGEKSYENANLKHGVFFHFLIQGLKGEADSDKNGAIDVDEVVRFTKSRVPDFVKDEYGPDVRQMPVFRGEVRGLPVLVRRDRPAAPDIAEGAPPKRLVNSIGMSMALIPAGEFWMGSADGDKEAFDDEKPRHRVRITRPFYLGTTEVTQGQYRAVTGKNPSSFKGSDDLPVEQVSWLDAATYCNALSEKEGLRAYYRITDGKVAVLGGVGYRLPTEAEWEYACRAGSTTRFSFGDDDGPLGDYAWYVQNSGLKTHPVAQKKANGFGLYDMHGNVWEWCSDWKSGYAGDPVDDPGGPLERAGDRVNRGGGWVGFARNARSAGRLGDAPAFRYDFLGFRAARDWSGG